MSVAASCFIDYEVTVRDQHHLLILNVSKIGIHINGNQAIFRYPILVPAETVAKRFNGGRVAGSDRQIWYMIEAILTADGRHAYLDPWLRKHTKEGK